MSDNDIKKPGNGGFSRLMSLAGSHKKKLVTAALFSTLGEGCGIVPFVMIYYIAMELTGGNEVRQAFIWTLIWVGVGALVLKYLFLGGSTTLAHISAYNTLYSLRIKIAQKLTTLPLGFFNNNTTGRIKKIMLEDVEQMEIFLGHNLPEFFGAFIYIIITTVALFIVDWRLALATIIVLPIAVLIQSLNMRRAGGLMKRFFEASERVNTTMIEFINGIPVIKSFGHTVGSFRQYSDSVKNCSKSEEELLQKWFLSMALYSIFVSASLLFLLPVGTYLYLTGKVTIAVLVLFLLMGLGWTEPLFKMTSLGRIMQQNLEGIARIDSILNAEPLSLSSQKVIPRNNDIKVSQVEFAYDEQDVLKGIDMDVPEGNLVALVGASGAGKSTVARLIARFWDVKSGSIKIDGADIRDMEMDDLMENLSFIFQNSFLFDESIGDNIMIGKPEASLSEIQEAAKAAQCHDFISALPDGYDTVVGERGARLSGGEKQRICIARAILKNSPVLIMDEASAFIDPDNEIVMHKAINELSKNKTIIFIAHRLSTIAKVDQISVIANGEIAEQGTHSELLEKNGLYKNMWDAHTGTLRWEI